MARPRVLGRELEHPPIGRRRAGHVAGLGALPGEEEVCFGVGIALGRRLLEGRHRLGGATLPEQKPAEVVEQEENLAVVAQGAPVDALGSS